MVNVYDVASWLRISPNWLTWPDIVIWIIIPYIITWYAIGSLIKMTVFQKSKYIPYLIALGLAMFTLPLGSFAAVGSLFFICWYKIRGWKGGLVGIVVAILYFIILPGTFAGGAGFLLPSISILVPFILFLLPVLKIKGTKGLIIGIILGIISFILLSYFIGTITRMIM